MSNIGKKKIDIPEGISLKFNPILSNIIVGGKLGEIILTLSKEVTISQEKDQLT